MVTLETVAPAFELVDVVTGKAVAVEDGLDVAREVEDVGDIQHRLYPAGVP